MVLVNVESLVIGLLPMPSIITLRVAEHREDIPEDLVLPIWIGTMEATAIAAALEGNATERPITHALTIDLVGSLGGNISRVVIDRVEDDLLRHYIFALCKRDVYARRCAPERCNRPGRSRKCALVRRGRRHAICRLSARAYAWSGRANRARGIR